MKIKFRLNPNDEIAKSLLPTFIAPLGFDSFEEVEHGINAYINEKVLDLNAINDKLREISNGYYPIKVEYSYDLIANENWNSEWEKNSFEPIIISNECLVQSSLYAPNADYKYNILINPEMSFGTGGHQTTKMILEYILSNQFSNRKVLDIGCGTGILSILSAKKNAQTVLAIDIDEWAYKNARLNVVQNDLAEKIEVMLGDITSVSEDVYDVLFANINRNIILKDIAKYSQLLVKGGQLYLSGFYVSDAAMVEKSANNNGLELKSTKITDDWTALLFVKTI